MNGHETICTIKIAWQHLLRCHAILFLPGRLPALFFEEFLVDDLADAADIGALAGKLGFDVLHKILVFVLHLAACHIGDAYIPPHVGVLNRQENIVAACAQVLLIVFPGGEESRLIRCQHALVVGGVVVFGHILQMNVDRLADLVAEFAEIVMHGEPVQGDCLQLLHGDRPLPGERMVFGKNQTDGFGHDILGGDQGMEDGVKGEGEIGLVGQQHGSRLFYIHVAQPDLQIAKLVQKEIGDMKDREEKGTARKTHVYMVVHRTHQPGSLAHQHVVGFAKLLKARQQDLGLLAEDQFVFVPVKQREAQFLFQPGDGKAESGLGDVQFFGRFVHIHVFYDRKKMQNPCIIQIHKIHLLFEYEGDRIKQV